MRSTEPNWRNLRKVMDADSEDRVVQSLIPKLFMPLFFILSIA